MFPMTRAFGKKPMPIPKLCIHVAEASTKNKYAMADTSSHNQGVRICEQNLSWSKTLT